MADTKAEQLEYNHRNYGKSFKQWQKFLAYSKAGEDIVYLTPEGEVCSPARVKKLVAKAQEELLDELEVLNLHPFVVGIGEFIETKRKEIKEDK